MVFWSDEYDQDELYGFHEEQEAKFEAWLMENVGRVCDDMVYERDDDEGDDDGWS
jgi:hypothetical protein